MFPSSARPFLRSAERVGLRFAFWALRHAGTPEACKPQTGFFAVFFASAASPRQQKTKNEKLKTKNQIPFPFCSSFFVFHSLIRANRRSVQNNCTWYNLFPCRTRLYKRFPNNCKPRGLPPYLWLPPCRQEQTKKRRTKICLCVLCAFAVKKI